ncbi:hypothetical protein EDM80_06040 [bacterium]|nr:MAG: hypothetical protein EDM80_06040 [bacterium]RIK63731.1 MAG: hypothetical protein DCC64_06350 [Planctomycetota bacterium]
MLDYVTIRGLAGTSAWRFSGANRANTDHGRLYSTVVVSEGDAAISLYSDAARTAAVAGGTLPGGRGLLVLEALNHSGLSGRVRLDAPSAGKGELDLFYACGDDLAALQAGIAGFLSAGRFAGEPGFDLPCASAKRTLDCLLQARQGPDRLDSLQPLADVAAHYAMAFIYDFLTHRQGEPAAYLAEKYRRQAASALAALRLSVEGRPWFPFSHHVKRA